MFPRLHCSLRINKHTILVIKQLQIIINNLQKRNMEYSYRIDDSKNIIFVTAVGDLTSGAFDEVGLKIFNLALTVKSSVVFDFSRVTVKISLGEIYFWFSNHLDKVDAQFRNIPTAVVSSAKNETFFHFVETTWTNHGAKTMVFKDEFQAQNWLISLPYADSEQKTLNINQLNAE